MRARLPKRDWIGLTLILILTAAAIAFRQLTIVPRAYVAVCAATRPPFICIPRHAVLWAQYERWFGLAALILGILAFAFARRALGIMALAIGIIATVNYNGTEGIFGASLGLWAWLDAATKKPMEPHAHQ